MFELSSGRECPTDCCLRLINSEGQARDYAIDSVPWLILNRYFLIYPLDQEVAEYIWNSFDKENYFDV